MSMNKRECYYSPNVTDDRGVVTNESADFYKMGYLEYWGQSTAVSYSMTPDGSYIPIIQHVVVAVVQDKETGKVHICNAEQIKFKV